ncbi:MAG: hypothetical protein N2C14_32320, partial [Planctomycetales bacterium]
MMEEKRISPFQFSIRDLLLVIVYVACCLGWLRMLRGEYGYWHYYPGPRGEYGYWHYYPGGGSIVAIVGLLIPAYIYLNTRSPSACSKVWNRIVLTWFIVLATFAHGVIGSFSYSNSTGRAPWKRAGGADWFLDRLVGLVHATWIPLFFTIPLLYLLIVRRKSSPEGM